MGFLRRPIRSPIVAAIAVLAVLGAACGGGDAEAGLTVGDEAPGFALPGADGSTVSLGGYDGPVLLYFHMADG